MIVKNPYNNLSRCGRCDHEGLCDHWCPQILVEQDRFRISRIGFIDPYMIFDPEALDREPEWENGYDSQGQEHLSLSWEGQG